MAPRWKILTFAGLEVCSETREIKSFGTRKARTLLARLALANRPIDRDRLAAFLWPEDLEESTKPRLRTELHRLRTLLSEDADLIVVQRDALSLDRSLVAVDVDLFDERLRLARAETDSSSRIAAYERAFALYRGELLPHETDDWFVARRLSLTESVAAAFEDAASTCVRVGDCEQGVRFAKRAVDAMPLRATATIVLMKTLAELGDSSGAVEAYDLYESRVRDQLGMGADPRVVEVLDAIRCGKITSTTPPVAASHNLPPKTGHVFGREPTFASLSVFLLPALARLERIVTLVGPGGVGKTTLALETARRLADEYRQRVTFVPLAEVQDVPALTGAVARALNVPLSSAAALDAITDRLDGLPSLLVLDNFEQMAPEASRWVADLSRRVSGLRILVTSRRPLGLPEEQRLSLEPLPTPVFPGTKPEISTMPAVALFVEASRRVRPDYDPDERELNEISRLAARLDGLPLALILAAGRIGAFTPAEMLRDIGIASPPSSSKPGASERHNSLADAIDWSIDLLDASSREFLNKLTVFPADWSLAAAKGVIGPEANQILPTLVDHSLVVRKATPDGSRYSLLQTIREHLRTKLETSLDLLRTRHADWALDLLSGAHPLRSNNLTEYLAALSPEYDNIIAALNWLEVADRNRYRIALSMIWFYWHIRPFDETSTHRLLEAARETEEQEGILAAELSFGAAMLLCQRGRYKEGEERADVADRLFSGLGDRRSALEVYRVRVHLAYYQGDYAAAAKWARKGIEEGEDLGEKTLTAICYANLGLAMANVDRGDEALEAIERSIEINEQNGDTVRALNGRHLAASVLLSLRRWSEAESVLTNVLAEATRTGDTVLQGHCHTHLTTVSVRTGRLAEAQAHLDRADELAGEASEAFSRGVRSYLGALVAIALQDRNMAFARAQNLLAAWSSIRTPTGILPAIDLSALVLASFGLAGQAKELLDGADAIRSVEGAAVSPHYRMVYEDARQIAGPWEPDDDIEAPTTIELTERAKHYLKSGNSLRLAGR